MPAVFVCARQEENLISPWAYHRSKLLAAASTLGCCCPSAAGSSSSLVRRAGSTAAGLAASIVCRHTAQRGRGLTQFGQVESRSPAWATPLYPARPPAWPIPPRDSLRPELWVRFSPQNWQTL